MHDSLMTDFLAAHGWDRATHRPLAGDASFRRYIRLHRGEQTAMLMDAQPPREDVRPFVAIDQHLYRLGYSVPRILAQDLDNGFLLLEDLGDDTYTRLIARGHDEASLYALAIDVLADLHRSKDAIFPDLPPYDDARLLTEACLLTEWYCPHAAPISPAAEEEYKALWQQILPLARSVPQTLVLRDFHVDNLMLLPRDGIKACGLLDFQDAVAGPLTYDTMSLLEDARRDLDGAMVEALKQRYLAQMPDLSRQDFDLSWAVMAACRHAKVIGIFTRLCKRDGKSHYLHHIPRVWRLLDQAVRHPALADLKSWLDCHIPQNRRIIPTP